MLLVSLAGKTSAAAFILGVVVTRSAGCIINDFADRDIDKKVRRTADRPLTSGIESNQEALTVNSLFYAS